MPTIEIGILWNALRRVQIIRYSHMQIECSVQAEKTEQQCFYILKIVIVRWSTRSVVALEEEELALAEVVAVAIPIVFLY